MEESSSYTPVPTGFLSVKEIVLIASLAVTIGIAWGTIQASLTTMHELLMEVQAQSEVNSKKLDLIRDQQIRSEFLIDQHSAELEQLEAELKMRVSMHHRAAADPTLVR